MDFPSPLCSKLLRNEDCMKKIVFVLNPHSGKALIKNALLKIIQVFSEAGYDVTVYPTKAPLDGYEYLKKREGQYDVLTER